ncbi:MAG: Na(+)-translocating NADH-quinone reductase subunit A [Tannerella sp.]|jgi:Na+-transporting NADH:ubiquinone oxidoreductase subunit A|nr:Na(+)-translocating NADH-quinone reductase subunit A [Tannerella sp.]
MATVIKIKKGLNINLKGKAPEVLMTAAKSESYAIVPDHYTGITPKVMVRPGDRVKAGSVLMTDKRFPEIRFVSPVSGEVAEVLRGEKRKVLRIAVKPDEKIEYESFPVKEIASLSGEEIKALLLEAGLWPYIKQRPYDRVAAPDITPRDIFVTACDTAPLAPDFEFVVKGEEDAFQAGLDALAKLTGGHVYLGVKKNSTLSPQHVEPVELDGPHPAGNVGVLINRIRPVNKGETVWTLHAADVLFIGRLFLKGTVDFSRRVALTGSEMTGRGYVNAIAGCTIQSLTKGRTLPGDKHIRLISGNVLTGTKVAPTDCLGAYDNQITAIPEGDEVDEFLGWGMPGFGKYSVNRSYFTWLTGKNKEHVIDARIRGGRRAMIMSNEYDRVFPMDILPEYLLKAIIAFDIEKMENLGIYEVAPEDFALCEFVDTSKIELQKIVRNGLDLLYREMN